MEPTLRDYFAHGAGTAPDWFVHTPAPGEPPEPQPRALGEEYGAYVARNNTEVAAHGAWASRDGMARLVQWRWAFADAMIAARPLRAMGCRVGLNVTSDVSYGIKFTNPSGQGLTATGGFHFEPPPVDGERSEIATDGRRDLDLSGFTDWIGRNLYLSARDSAGVSLEILSTVYRKLYGRIPDLEKLEALYGEHATRSKPPG